MFLFFKKRVRRILQYVTYVSIEIDVSVF